MHFCKAANLIGCKGTGWLPTAPWDYNWGSVLPAIGCNNLHCADCGAPVRSFAKASIQLSSRFDLRTLYEAADYRSLTFMREDPASLSRLYVCRCAYQFIVGWEAVETLVKGGGRTLIWTCQGHPLPEFPLHLDGHQIVPDADFPGLLRAVLPRYWPAPLPPLQVDDRGFWVARLYKLLPDAESRRGLGNSVAQILLANEPALWPGVLRFFMLLPGAQGSQTLAELPAENRILLAGEPDSGTPHRNLEDLLFQVLMRRTRGRRSDEAAVEVLIGALLSGRNSPGLLGALAHKRPLLRSYAQELVAVSPHLMDELIYFLRHDGPGLLIPMLRSLSRIPGITLPAICVQVEAVVAEPARAAILAALS